MSQNLIQMNKLKKKDGKVMSTAGAIPVKNDKGELSMKKVKVTRYVAGKRPDYAGYLSSSSDDSDSETEDLKPPVHDHRSSKPHSSSYDADVKPEEAARDRRLQRILQVQEERDDSKPRRRQIAEPEEVYRHSDPDSDEETKEEARARRREELLAARREERANDSPDDEDADMSDEEIERRRNYLRQRARLRQQQEEAATKQEEEEESEEGGSGEEGEEEESSEEDYTDSDDDETGPRLKPVFVKKKDRITLQESEKEAERLRLLELQEKKKHEERKVNSARLVEQIVKHEVEMEKKKKEDEAFDLDAVNTDDENEELAYEAWKLRELKRIKRDKDEREQIAKEKAEYDRIHNMSEEERRAYLRANPRLVTNKAEKGKYKFLQKYFHRGVFFLDEEDQVYKKNFAEPTLEDHFDKSVLPKVMQVKDFGKAGRTKWTHLVAEDTTDFDSAWVSETAQNMKYHNKHGGGVKEYFDRPANKKKK